MNAWVGGWVGGYLKQRVVGCAVVLRCVSHHADGQCFSGEEPLLIITWPTFLKDVMWWRFCSRSRGRPVVTVPLKKAPRSV